MSDQDIAKRLLVLSEAMISLGVDMDYYGGFSQIGEKGRELVGAGVIARQWSQEIVKDDDDGIAKTSI
jgi:hypothetical protein